MCGCEEKSSFVNFLSGANLLFLFKDTRHFGAITIPPSSIENAAKKLSLNALGLVASVEPNGKLLSHFH